MKPLLALAGLLLAACAALPGPRGENPTLYLLDAQPVALGRHPQSGLVLELDRPRARPGYATSQMAYVREAHRLDYYAKNRWVDAPARMLAPLLAQTLAQSGAFRAVLPAPAALAPDLRLDTELVRLEQDFTTRPSRVRLTLRLELIDLGAAKLVGTREIDEAEAAASEDARGGASAANRALARALARSADFCAAAASLRR